MNINSTMPESTENKNNVREITNINKAPTHVIIYYGETPPEYEVEMLTYIDTPPKYEGSSYERAPYDAVTIEPKPKIEPKSKIEPKPKSKASPTPKPKNTLSNRKGTCCYSRESDESRCCGACYWLCPPNPKKERCECCPNTFCDYWKSGYIQTTQGGTRDEDSCHECECDDCFCTTICLPFKFPVFFPCFLGSLFNNCINELCVSNRNYLF